MIVVTGATGHLGRLVVGGLLEKLPASAVAVAVRRPERAADLAALGVQVRYADYSRPETLGKALDGADRVLLVSANEVGKRAEQHLAVVRAAKRARVELLAYTSILRAGTSTLDLAREHRATEDAIRSSGLRYVFLRNGWYIENYTEHLGPLLERGFLLGCAGSGRVAGATRADYAAAAAAVLLGARAQREIYELAGDEPFTMPELAAEISRHAGRTVVYQDLPREKYEAALRSAGLPGPAAALYADSDAGVARGELDDSTGDLRRLIGRATTPLRVAVAAAFASLPRSTAA